MSKILITLDEGQVEYLLEMLIAENRLLNTRNEILTAENTRMQSRRDVMQILEEADLG